MLDITAYGWDGQTTNLRVGRSNRSGRAISLPEIIEFSPRGRRSNGRFPISGFHRSKKVSVRIEFDVAIRQRRIAPETSHPPHDLRPWPAGGARPVRAADVTPAPSP